MTTEKHFTTRQVAEICGVNLNTIQNWARRDLINGFRTAGGHLRFRESDLVEFLDRQGIPIPSELASREPRVFCLCRDCDAAKSIGRWMKKDFDCQVFSDPWEMALAVGADAPELVVVDLSETDPESTRMLDAIGTNPRTAHVPVIVLSDRGASGERRKRRATLARDGLRPADLRKKADNLIGRA